MRTYLSAFALSALIAWGLSASRIQAQSAPARSGAAAVQSQDYPDPAAARPQQKDETAGASFQTQSATGKITAVSGDTFAIEIGNAQSTETMQFVVDSNTAKSGDLKVGSTATVQYHSSPDGKNTATKVDVQG